MPLYAYRCTKCNHRFEKIQNFSAAPELECPRCQGLLERPLTAPALQFKGAGWYVNDYSAKNAAPVATESAAPAAAAPAAAAPCASASACPAAASCASAAADA